MKSRILLTGMMLTLISAHPGVSQCTISPGSEPYVQSFRSETPGQAALCAWEALHSTCPKVVVVGPIAGAWEIWMVYFVQDCKLVGDVAVVREESGFVCQPFGNLFARKAPESFSDTLLTEANVRSWLASNQPNLTIRDLRLVQTGLRTLPYAWAITASDGLISYLKLNATGQVQFISPTAFIKMQDADLVQDVILDPDGGKQ